MKKYELIDFRKNHEDEENIIDLIRDLRDSSHGNKNELISSKIITIMLRALKSQADKNELIFEIAEWTALLYMIDNKKSMLTSDTLNKIMTRQYNEFNKSYLKDFVLPFVKKLEEEEKKYKKIDKKVSSWEAERANIINEFNTLIKELDKKVLEKSSMN